MNDFKDAKVGDRVWDIVCGWGTIVEINVGQNIEQAGQNIVLTGSFMHITVRFDSECIRKFNQNGSMIQGAHNEYRSRTLFWDEVKIEPPPKPKKRVKKAIEGWVNILPSLYDSQTFSVGCTYPSKESAFEHRDASCLGDPYPIKHEYWEDE